MSIARHRACTYPTFRELTCRVRRTACDIPAGELWVFFQARIEGRPLIDHYTVDRVFERRFFEANKSGIARNLANA